MTNGIVITDVNMKIKDGNGMKAICTVTVNGMIAINDIRIVENKNQELIVAMPSKRMPDGKFKDLANPVNAQARSIIQDAVINRYSELTTLSNELFLLIS